MSTQRKKDKKVKRFVMALTLGMVAVASLAGCGLQNRRRSGGQDPGEDTFTRIRREGTIRVGYIVYSPFVIQDPNTKDLSGTFVDAMREIADQMEVKLDFQESTWSTFIAGLQSRRFDVSIAPTFSTISRAKSVAFTTPLIAAGNSAIVRKGEARFNSIQDIAQKGIVVAVTQGEQGHEYAKANLTNAEIKVFASRDQNLAFSEVLAGRADVALGDFWAVKQFAERQENAVDLFADNPYNITPIGWAVRYDDLKLLAFLNTSLSCLDASGNLDAINKKYDAKFLRPITTWK